MHTQYLPLRRPMYTPEFKAEVMTTLLFNLSATSDISSRYGVPPSHVRRWIRELVVHLCDVYAHDGAPEPPKQSHFDEALLTLPGLYALLWECEEPQ